MSGFVFDFFPSFIVDCFGVANSYASSNATAFIVDYFGVGSCF